MKVFLLFGVFIVGIALTLANSQDHEESSSSSEESSEELENDHHGHGGHGQHRSHHDKCHGLEEVDLSDLDLDITDLRKLVSKDIAEKADGSKFPFLENGQVSVDDIKTNVAEHGMGVVRKMVVLADKKKIFAKIMKTSKASGDFTTSVSGSTNTSIEASTSGKASFGLDLEIFTANAAPHNTLSGEAQISAKSSTAWVKKAKINVLQTKSTSNSATKISWSDATSSLANAGSMTANSSATSSSSTVLLSKKCFASRAGFGFNASAAGAGWTSSVVGKGKGGVFTRVIFATANGTSLSWTFAKLTIKTHLEVKGGNTTVDGTQYITVKSFTETIVRPMNPAAASNADRQLEVSNEIKLRVEAKTTLKNGVKAYSTGGQLLFRNSKVTVPAETDVADHGSDGSADEVEPEHVMVANVLRKQVQADELLVNPVFVNSVFASAMN